MRTPRIAILISGTGTNMVALMKAAITGELPAEVMVVDNDEAILKTTSMLLKALGVKPHVARDRHESLGILRRLGPGIGAILLDADLGGIDTLRLLDAFRLASPKTAVVVASGSREEDLRTMFAGRRLDGFLAKPYTLAELKETLFAAIRASGNAPGR